MTCLSEPSCWGANMEESNAHIGETLQLFQGKRHLFARFMNAVVDNFSLEPTLNRAGAPIIHTIKNRLKDVDHLRDKIQRKSVLGETIDQTNLFSKVTDLAGVRVLHLYQDQFPQIHAHIMAQIASKDWCLHEDPIVYSWDPESISFFQNLQLRTEIKSSHYTSIHYLVKPNAASEICCEIQVRTLFEEIWGEIDHTINYPHPTTNAACREQLRVLSKLVSTGTRLADSIFRVQAMS